MRNIITIQKDPKAERIRIIFEILHKFRTHEKEKVIYSDTKEFKQADFETEDGKLSQDHIRDEANKIVDRAARKIITINN